MKDGFLKAAAFSPALRVADCTYNAQQILTQLQTAAQRGVKLAVFPEFCLTGYTCGDLFLQHTLQTGALDALQTVLDGTRTLIGPKAMFNWRNRITVRVLPPVGADEVAASDPKLLGDRVHDRMVRALVQIRNK